MGHVWKSGTFDRLIEPQQIKHLENIKQIAAGTFHYACLDSFGEVSFFVGNAQRTIAPSMKEEFPAIVSIACGSKETICLDDNGNVWGFGDATIEDVIFTPRRMPGLVNIHRVSCGEEFIIFQDINEKFFVLGQNNWCQLGIPDRQARETPTPVPDTWPRNIHSFCCGACHTILLDRDGSIFGFGGNISGQTGISDADAVVCCPTRVEVSVTFKTISCGYHHSLAIDSDDVLYAFGANGNFQVSSIPAEHVSPAPVPGLPKISQISKGGIASIVKDFDDNVYVFGWNTCGQLGIGKNQEHVKVPTVLSRTGAYFGKTTFTTAKSARN